MKTTLKIILILGLILSTSCSKDDSVYQSSSKFDFGAQKAGDIALLAYDGDSNNAIKTLETNNLITGTYSLQSNSMEQISKAINKAQNGAIVYIVVDCSVFGNEMPTKALNDLKTFREEWADGKYYENSDSKTILPIWLVNIVNDQEGKDIFGMSMGPGWYMLSTDLNMPKFYLGETLDNVDFKQFVPQYVPYRFSQQTLDSLFGKESNNIKSKATRSTDVTEVQLKGIQQVFNIRYYYYQPKWGEDGWANPKVSRDKFKFNPKYLHLGLPSDEVVQAMKRDGGVQVDTKFTIEVVSVPGDITEKVVKVVAENGYHIIPNWEWSDVMKVFVHTGDAFINYLLRSYKVEFALRHSDGTIDLESRVPDVQTMNYEYSDTKSFGIDFGVSGKVSDKGPEAGASLGFKWSSSETVRYTLQDMYISSQTELASATKLPVSWVITPQIWYSKNAFMNDDKSRALDVTGVLTYWTLAAGNSDTFRPVLGTKRFSEMNFDTNTGAKQIAVYHIRNSTADLFVDLNAILEFQHTNVQYRAGHLLNYWGENVEDGAICTKVNLNQDNSKIKKSVKISFGTPTVFPAITEVK